VTLAVEPTSGRPVAPAADPRAPDAIPERVRPTEPATPPDSLGDALLRSLALQAAVPAAPPVTPATAPLPAPPTPPGRLRELQEHIAATVSRLLVSDPLHDGARELRIEFAKEILPDTSVRLWRDAGRLHVEFTSTAAIAEGGLREGLPRLAEAIQRQSPQSDPPQVSLRLGESGGQPGDGRSRQRYQAFPEEGETA
jgi:hypothetical protein